MKLDILIPTYNRANYLLKNLRFLEEMILNSDLKNIVSIIISNNCSTDNTESLTNGFIKNTKINVKYFRQEANIGLERNALFVLGSSDADYVMYLGDDDFINKDFLNRCVELIREYRLNVIIPNYIPVDLNGNILGNSRDINCANRHFKGGFNNCIENSWRGHQLSGLVLKREGLLKAYTERSVKNIYLFIFFVAYNCLKGDAYHLTQFPVKVTQPGQQNKDWNYGNDGLINEIFDNYKKLPISKWRITKLQLITIKKQPWRLNIYKQKGWKEYIHAYMHIWFSSNSTLLFKILFPIHLLILNTKKRVFRRYYFIKNLLAIKK